MKFIAYGDFHAHLFTDFAEVDTETGNSRFTQQLEALRFMNNYCVENDISLTLFAGDMYHKRKAVDQTVKNRIRDEVKRFGQFGIWTVMIPGNHDQVDNSDFPQHSLHSFRELEKVVLLDRFDPYFLPWEIAEGEEAFIYPVPYSKNAEMVKQEINRYAEHAKARPEVPHILLGHLGVSGAYVGKGSYAMADAFTVSDLHPEAFNFGVFGHFHKRQQLGGHEHYFYTGSPLQHSFNDEGEDKGFYVCDTTTGKAEFVAIPAPQFITVKVKKAADIKRVKKELEGNFLRIQVEAEHVDKLVSELPDEAKFRIEVQKEYTEERRIDVDSSMPIAQIITEYSKEFNEDALDVGLEILREVEEGL